MRAHRVTQVCTLQGIGAQRGEPVARTAREFVRITFRTSTPSYGWLKSWLEDFNGVATNYLGWRRVLDMHKYLSPNSMLNLALGRLQYISEHNHQTLPCVKPIIIYISIAYISISEFLNSETLVSNLGLLSFACLPQRFGCSSSQAL